MHKKAIIAGAISLLIIALTAGILARPQPAQESKTKIYTYPFTVKDKTYIVTLETNWTAQKAPSVSLTNSSLTPYGVILHFLGGNKETITYNITIPTDLISGNITLIWKYYVQNPDRYILTNNGTANTLQMTFDYNPPFSGIGYFEFLGTEGAW
jgi:hypothetical protein